MCLLSHVALLFMGVFQQNRPEPFIRVAVIRTNPMAAIWLGAVPRLWCWRIAGVGQEPTFRELGLLGDMRLDFYVRGVFGTVVHPMALRLISGGLSEHDIRHKCLRITIV